MNKPSAELLTETFTTHNSVKGYHFLRGQGYDVTRRECLTVRNQLIAANAIERGKAYDKSIVEKVREMAAAGATTGAIGRAIGATTRQTRNLCQRHGIKAAFDATPNAIPMPDRDKLVAALQVNSVTQAGKVFGVSFPTIKRWMGIYGLERVEPVKPARPALPVRPSKRPFGRQWTAAAIPAPEHSAANDAATYLRQQGYSNVYRRNRSEWQVGGRVMAEKDMLARVVEIKARRARLAGVA